jgi:hypothetical protein
MLVELIPLQYTDIDDEATEVKSLHGCPEDAQSRYIIQLQ